MAADPPLDLDEIEAETRAEWRKNPSAAALDCLALVAEVRQLRTDRDRLRAAIVRWDNEETEEARIALYEIARQVRGG